MMRCPGFRVIWVVLRNLMFSRGVTRPGFCQGCHWAQHQLVNAVRNKWDGRCSITTVLSFWEVLQIFSWCRFGSGWLDLRHVSKSWDRNSVKDCMCELHHFYPFSLQVRCCLPTCPRQMKSFCTEHDVGVMLKEAMVIGVSENSPWRINKV